MSNDFKHKECRGSIFHNEKKENEDDRDYNGACLIDGKEYWVSGYKNTSKNTGKTYLGLMFKSKDATHDKGVQQAQQAAEPPPANDFYNDDINF